MLPVRGVIEGSESSRSDRGRQPSSHQNASGLRVLPRAEDFVVQINVLRGRSILVVGDDPRVVRRLRLFFEQRDAAVLTATGVDEALYFAEHPRLAAAVLDFALGIDARLALCRALMERGVPFFFHGEPGAAEFQFWPFSSLIRESPSQAAA